MKAERLIHALFTVMGIAAIVVAWCLLFLWMVTHVGPSLT